MRTRTSLLTILLLLIASVGTTQQHPNVARGLMPAQSYELGDVDAINLFNGAVNITIPIGQKYSVGGSLAYQFTLSNAPNAWDVVEYTEPGSYNNEPILNRYQYTIPQAGMRGATGVSIATTFIGMDCS